MTTLTQVQLQSSLEAAAQARTAVRAALEGESQDTVDRGCILVDELVASALVAVGAPLQLLIERHPDRLVVEVVDAGTGSPTSDETADRLGVASQILDAWASEWGAVDQPTGTSVWFSLPVG